MITLEDMSSEMKRLSDSIDKALGSLHQQAKQLADAEHAYRKAIAVAWLEVRRADEGTAADKDAQVKSMTADLRQTRDLADGLRVAALEAIRSRRTQVSALQSLMNAHRAEAEIAKYDGRPGA